MFTSEICFSDLLCNFHFKSNQIFPPKKAKRKQSNIIGKITEKHFFPNMSIFLNFLKNRKIFMMISNFLLCAVFVYKQFTFICFKINMQSQKMCMNWILLQFEEGNEDVYGVLRNQQLQFLIFSLDFLMFVAQFYCICCVNWCDFKYMKVWLKCFVKRALETVYFTWFLVCLLRKNARNCYMDFNRFFKDYFRIFEQLFSRVAFIRDVNNWWLGKGSRNLNYILGTVHKLSLIANGILQEFQK